MGQRPARIGFGVGWLALLVLLGACSGAFPATVAVVPSAEATRTPAPYASRTPTPALTETHVAAAQSTRAVFVETLQAEGTRAVGARMTADAAEWQATATVQVQALQTRVRPRVLETVSAPDGQRAAVVTAYDCTRVDPVSDWEQSYEELSIDGQVVAQQLLNCGGIGAGGLGGLFWSQNGRFFYFTSARAGQPDGGGPWIRPIQRFDTQTGAVDGLGGAVFSAGGLRVAGGQDSATFAVWDVEQGDLAHFAYAGSASAYSSAVAWSPDETQLAFAVQDCPAEDCFAVLLRAELASGQITELARLPGAQINQLAWPEASTLRFFDYTGFNEVVFTIDSGALATVTPGP